MTTSATSVPGASAAELVARYLAGAPRESEQFDFLIGEWSATTTRFASDGSPVVSYEGHWTASWLAARRMLEDRFTALAPDGTEIGFFVTLRTYCESSARWEMTFLTALQPQPVTSFTGTRVGDEMHLLAKGQAADGSEVTARVRFFEIGPDSFRWEQRTSRDDGASWRLESAIEARRIAGRDNRRLSRSSGEHPRFD